ncbi:unnamed protein product [Mytilus coruscus]|uniref:Uncharacterized protein n=1 Tax=Mytilus coruscus TaxID=42192 RepID=A0A6J8ET24_MYTCO|nr:unnamed protein product [Mytilus coruscus]
MPCFEPEDVIFLTNQWDVIENTKGDGDEEDQHTKTWNKIQSKLDEGWPGFNTDRLFKISLKQVGENLKTPFTKQYKNFQALLEKTIDRNKNKRVEYYFRFVQKFAVDAEMGISSRINLIETSDDKRKETILKNQSIVSQLEAISQQKMVEAKEYKTQVIFALAEKLSSYLYSDRGRKEILNPQGRPNINSLPLHAFGEEVFTRINMGINRWCSGDDVMTVIKEIENEMKKLLSDVQSMIHDIEKDITGFARSIHDASFTFFSRSTLRVTLRRNGINFIEYLTILFKRSPLRNRYRQLKEKKAEQIYEAWLLSFTSDQILSSFEDNFGPEYDKVIARIFEKEIPQKITSFKLTMKTLLDELLDTKKKKRSFTQLKELVHEIKAQIEHFKEISQM